MRGGGRTFSGQVAQREAGSFVKPPYTAVKTERSPDGLLIWSIMNSPPPRNHN